MEFEIASDLDSKGIGYEYESTRIPYTEPEKKRTYTPDFVLPNGIIIEAKGRWDVADRRKHKLIKEQHPELDIRLVFSNPKAKIRKGIIRGAGLETLPERTPLNPVISNKRTYEDYSVETSDETRTALNRPIDRPTDRPAPILLHHAEACFAATEATCS